jgi:uncharacterized protein YidB (DUF937 family)
VSTVERRAEMGAFDSLLEDHGGDLKELVAKFESSGLGDKAKSWVGIGPNEPIGADEVKRALGPKVSELAARLGIRDDEVAEQLASSLPDAVDKATPDGSLPTSGAVETAGAQAR